MKKSAKKLIALLLTAVMLLGCGLISASAAEADYSLIYSAYGRFGPYVLSYVNGYKNSLGDAGVLEIPAEISGAFDILLTEVADNAFAYYNPTDTNAAKYNKEIKELVFSDLAAVLGEQSSAIGPFVIGDHSFYNLAKLEKVVIKGDVIIEDYAFANCASATWSL